MSAAKRVKRASAEDLYKTCATGDCPPDVKNKIEGTTLADTLLKIFSSVIYLGGLGIGTGRGSGGATGYRPIRPQGDFITGSGSRTTGTVSGSGSVLRPNIPISPVGPAELIPVDVVNPESSAIVPLLEGGGGVSIESSIPEIPPDIVDAGVTTPSDPISDVTGTGGHPSVGSTATSDVAIIEVTPAPPTQTRVAYTDSTSTPHSVSILSSVSHGAEPSNFNVYVDTNFSGDNVGLLEEIELQPKNTREEFEIAEPSTPPKTSTPREAISRALSRARDLYNRRVTQLRTRNPEFLGQPSRAVVFEFENPAFDEDVTLEFNQGLDALGAAPDPDFQDVVLLSRPRYSETAEGRVRVSRLGKKGTIRTRAGTQIGQHIHYFYDVSTIDTADTIEMGILGEHSGDVSIVDAPAESSFVDNWNFPEPPFADEDLVDDLAEDFSESHLLLTASETTGDTYSIPTLPPGVVRIVATDVGNGLFVSVPEAYSPTDIFIPSIPVRPDEPLITINVGDSNDYYLHPALLSRKRKRKYSTLY
ncbi:late protein 2 [Callithrix penicillata papillomavirus type 1]|uniref:Minor capsid protein L2 n=1 Tax=Callithrix penicillata papillomavirus type 1 TaxID=2704503 RepID=A0A6C0TCK9_9PAPI|nr:late protein 2 [Callithrix penicillata papillomavirus type 1]